MNSTLRISGCALVLLLAAVLRAGELPGTTRPNPSVEGVPEGLAGTDWQSIRAAHSAWLHGFTPAEGGWQARNPGQQWTTTFDGRGFLATPKSGDWTWGLELDGYGVGGGHVSIRGQTPAIRAEGQRLTYQWDSTLQEWWVNDPRGLEHGYTLARRPEPPSPDAVASPLSLLLNTRGTLSPRVGDDALGVHFQDESGTTVLKYAGLKAWDADGRALATRFEAAGDGQVRLLVEDRAARYPITIDPLARQAFAKASGTSNFGGAENQFGFAVAVTSDTVVIGAPYEDSSSMGVNSTPDEGALDAGAAYVFARSGTTWSQQAYLKPASVGDSQAGDNFGYSVSISGDTVAIGAPFEDSSSLGVNSLPDEGSSGAGAAYVFVREGTTWSQQAYLKPASVGTRQAGDSFGEAVAVSGEVLVVGANFEDSSTTGINNLANESAVNAGAAYVFARNGTIWTQQATLKPAAIGTTQVGDQFGFKVAVSGDTVVIGAVGEDSDTTGINSKPNENGNRSGAAYVYVRDGTTWSQQAYLKPAAVGTTQFQDQFGFSVKVSGDTVVIGAPFEDSSVLGPNNTPDEGAPDAGAAYVFTRSGTTWSQQAYLKPAAVGATQEDDLFGVSVDVSGDTVVVGALFEDGGSTAINSSPDEGASASGAAYVFVRSGSTWNQQAYVKAAAIGSTQEGDQFGRAVAISGDTLVVGAPFEDSGTMGINSGPDEGADAFGAGFVYRRTGTNWVQEAHVKSSESSVHGANDQFGFSVAVSGNTAVVGAAYENSGSTGINSTPDDTSLNSGAAYVFVRSGLEWSQQAYLKPAAVGSEQRLDLFGYSVAISGDTVVVGANAEDGDATGINGTPNEGAPDAGAAYVFARTGTTWTQQAYLKPASVGSSQSFDKFGQSVAIEDNTIVVGASVERSGSTGVNSIPNEDAYSAGAAYVFVRDGAMWMQQAYLKPAAIGTSQTDDQFGAAVAVSGDTVVVGAVGEDSNTTGVNSTPNELSSGAGAVYVFTRNGTDWSQQAYLKPAAVGSSQTGDRFGASVAISGETVGVGAPAEDSGSTGINGTPNESASAAGAAYVFLRSGTTWSQQAYLKPAAVGTSQAGDQFGQSVTIAGDTVVVGAIGEDSGTFGVNDIPNETAGSAGAAYVFTRKGTAWSPLAYLKPDVVGTTQAGDQFGWSVAISGDTVVVGAPMENSSTTGVNGQPNEHADNSGAAHILLITPFAPLVAFVHPPGGHTDGGVPVTLYGDNFTGATAVSFGGVPATAFTVEGDGRITATTPAHPAGLVDVAVKGPVGTGIGHGLYRFAGDSNATDTDGDGLNDAAELRFGAFGFDPSSAQPSQVNAFLSGVNLYTPAQIQALHVDAPLLQRDGLGQFTLTIGVQKSSTLAPPSFVPFPMAAPQSSINGAGKLEFRFTAPDNAAYFRLESD